MGDRLDLNTAQKQALLAEGNVLVIAGAGTGKTRTLIERCIHRICSVDRPASLDQLLMVTFTDAAAIEMRQRLQSSLEQRLRNDPENLILQEQLALVSAASIGTLHSFCLRLVREHYLELKIDPQAVVLEPVQAALLAREELDLLLEEVYSGNHAFSEGILTMARDYRRAGPEIIRSIILQIHRYVQSLPDPYGWLTEQVTSWQQKYPTHWESWLIEEFNVWRQAWLSSLQGHDCVVLQLCCQALTDIGQTSRWDAIVRSAELIMGYDTQWPKGHRTVFRPAFRQFFDDVRFFQNLKCSEQSNPFVEDWEWTRKKMEALLRLTTVFGERYCERKRAMSVLEFSDLEQYALSLLWDRKQQTPTDIARQWRNRFAYLFVDEYQDINAAQDAILSALGREGDQANRFLVGDIKQSIYRFRLANPHIFQSYAASWSGKKQYHSVLSLQDNYRSHSTIIEFINQLFLQIMRKEIGGVAYGPEICLHAVKSFPEHEIQNNLKRVEIQILSEESADNDHEESTPLDDESSLLSKAERQARFIAMYLKSLVQDRFEIWDDNAKMFRPVHWGDMVILLRSPHHQAEMYAKEFTRVKVPLLTAQGGFYSSLEISDLLNLLRIIDNPLQDIPLLSVLHSPMFGFTPDDLVIIRSACPEGNIWNALTHFLNPDDPQKADLHQKIRSLSDYQSTFNKAANFMKKHRNWRTASAYSCTSRSGKPSASSVW